MLTSLETVAREKRGKIFLTFCDAYNAEEIREIFSDFRVCSRYNVSSSLPNICRLAAPKDDLVSRVVVRFAAVKELFFTFLMNCFSCSIFRDFNFVRISSDIELLKLELSLLSPPFDHSVDSHHRCDQRNHRSMTARRALTSQLIKCFPTRWNMRLCKLWPTQKFNTTPSLSRCLASY